MEEKKLLYKQQFGLKAQALLEIYDPRPKNANTWPALYGIPTLGENGKITPTGEPPLNNEERRLLVQIQNNLQGIRASSLKEPKFHSLPLEQEEAIYQAFLAIL